MKMLPRRQQRISGELFYTIPKASVGLRFRRARGIWFNPAGQSLIRVTYNTTGDTRLFSELPCKSKCLTMDYLYSLSSSTKLERQWVSYKDKEQCVLSTITVRFAMQGFKQRLSNLLMQTSVLLDATILHYNS